MSVSRSQSTTGEFSTDSAIAANDRALAAFAGQASFRNNVPDPLLAGKDLPTFKFALEKSSGKVVGDSYGKEATVTQLPISKGIAGVSMRLAAGAMRELHWHATAAEWAFVIEGRVRTTVVDPEGNAEVNDFDPGDVWYFPRGRPSRSKVKNGHRLLTAMPCSRNRPVARSQAAVSGASIPRNSPFRKPSPEWCSISSRALCANSIGIPPATNGTM
jgi:quercetin dioxygenase-like cupin family protein